MIAGHKTLGINRMGPPWRNAAGRPHDAKKTVHAAHCMPTTYLGSSTKDKDMGLKHLIQSVYGWGLKEQDILSYIRNQGYRISGVRLKTIRNELGVETKKYFKPKNTNICYLCKEHFVKGRTKTDIAQEVGLSGKKHAHHVFKAAFPDLTFNHYLKHRYGLDAPDPKAREQRKRKKRQSDPYTISVGRYRRRMRKALTSKAKDTNITDVLGCDTHFFQDWIQSLFKKGMSWKNKQQWHLDHIMPCSAFDLNQEPHRKVCFNFRNIQPIWANENIAKSDDMNSAREAFNSHPYPLEMHVLRIMLSEIGLNP